MCPPEAMDSIKDALARLVSPQDIIDDPALLKAYATDHSFVSGDVPGLLVYPHRKEDVQGIARLANEHKIPLIPVSSGPPRFRGDTVPARGGVIVDFSRMKRIMKIDPVNRLAMVEPGVTYGTLIPELKKQGQKLIAPLLPRASKSVVASRLEREPVIVPKYQYDYVDPLLTLEVVYGSGDEFRTGSASGPGTLDTLKADKANPWGPGSVDYFRFISGAQGTMGLVTWAITKTEVLPSLQKLFFIPVEDVRMLTAPMNALLRHRVVDECLALNNVNLATMLAEDWPADYEELKARLPSWTIIVCLAGYRRRPEERVGIMEKYLREACTKLGLKPQTVLPGAEGREKAVLELLSNPWHKEPYWKVRARGSCREIFFLAPLSQAPGYIETMSRVVARYRYPKNDIGGYIQPVVQGRGCHCEFNLPCDESSATEMAEVKRLFVDASETLMKNGAFFSRPYGLWSDMVYSKYGEGVTALKKLKGIFDPNNILNPGKLCF